MMSGHHHHHHHGEENSSKKNKNKNNTVVLGGGKHKLMMMIHNNIWQTMIFPVRRLCLALSTTINHRTKNGAGLVKLQDDVQTCEYEDIQVMWDMLHKTETHVIDNNRNKRPFWRLFICSTSNHTSKASSQSSNHT